MTTQHTPGPWRVTTAKVMAGNGRAICLIENRKLHEGFQESSANARIIAAAPDLLAALEVVREYMDHAADQFSYEDIVQIRAAIAKATKETA